MALGNIAVKVPDGKTEKQPSSRVLAENVVALLLLPKRAEGDRASASRTRLDLAPTYEYDPRPTNSDGTVKKKKDLTPLENQQFNQLPPVVQVTMVAVDEISAARLADATPDGPGWSNGLFTKCDKEADFVKDLGLGSDLKTDSLLTRIANPDNSLPTPKMNYRVYTMDVVIRGAKWANDL